MGFLFNSIRILDLVDILLVAVLLYQVYLMIRGTVAVNIFYGVFILYLSWLLVKALNMQLLGSILGQFIGLGLIVLLIVFQQEIRRFLLVLGTRYFRSNRMTLDQLFSFSSRKESDWDFDPLVSAIDKMSKSKTGSLIAIAKKSELRAFAETGVLLDSRIHSSIIEAIFQKESPLHDGAMILAKNRISAAGCVLPVTENPSLPAELGLRHRAAIGMSEHSDSFVVVVSEETGRIAYANQGQLVQKVKSEELKKILIALFKEIQG